MDEVFDGVFIGDIVDAQDNGCYFDAVVSVCSDTVKHTTHHKDIVDGKNEQEEFDEAVEKVKEAISEYDKVLVHCSSGVSRSVTTVSTVFAESREKDFDVVLDDVKRERQEAKPTFHMRQHAYEYLDEETTTVEEYVKKREE